MSYRDETLALREKLGALESEHARLEGRCAGLRVAVAEAIDRRARADEALASHRRNAGVLGFVGRRFGNVLGCLGAFLLFGGGCVVAAVVCEGAFPEIDETYHGHVASSARADLPANTACRFELDQRAETDPCAARLACGGAVVYEGVGRCAEPSGQSTVDYWDEPAAVEGGERALGFSARRGVAVLRQPLGATLVRLQ